jgi:hypothetical protein
MFTVVKFWERQIKALGTQYSAWNLVPSGGAKEYYHLMWFK